MASALTETEQINTHPIQKQDHRHGLHVANSSDPELPPLLLQFRGSWQSTLEFHSADTSKQVEETTSSLSAFLYVHTNLSSRNQAGDRPNDFTPLIVSRYQGKRG